MNLRKTGLVIGGSHILSEPYSVFRQSVTLCLCTAIIATKGNVANGIAGLVCSPGDEGDENHNRVPTELGCLITGRFDNSNIH